MTSLDLLIERVTGGHLPARFQDRARISLLGTLFHFTDWNRFNNEFQELTGYRWTKADHQMLVNDVLVMQHLRFALYRTLYHGHDRTVAEVQDLAKANQVSVGDMHLVRLCYENFREGFAEYKSMGYKPLTLAVFHQEFKSAYTDNKRFVKGWVGSKLRFLHNWGKTLPELEQDVVNSAYISLFKHYPKFKSRSHFRTLYRSCVEQAGIKQIQSSKAQKRAVMGDDNIRIDTSLDACLGDADNSMHEYTAAPDTLSAEDIMELNRLVRRLSQFQYGKVLIRLLVGDYTEAFCKWVSSTYHITRLDTYSLRYRDRFLTMCLEYCGISLEEYVEATGVDHESLTGC